jgi:heme/copper-type cytochrome/quinol oxidase subunit 3
MTSPMMARDLPTTGVGTRAPGWWGMALFCATEAGLFAYFLVAYFYLHGASAATSAEGGVRPSLTLPIVLTVLLVTSSMTLRWGERAIERGNARGLATSLGITIALGVAFLAVQAIEYSQKQYMPQTDAHWSMFYAITGFHGAHVALGLLMLATNLVRTVRGHFTSERRLAVQNGALYWHMVDAVWLAIFSALYLAPYLT